MCGEHAIVDSSLVEASGSSPHVRGAPVGFAAVCAEHGIIPACAGSTAPASTNDSNTWDHPRMCGEHLAEAIAAILKQGSSPHVRGARFILRLPADCLGIIPACAGSTDQTSVLLIVFRDHPRMCGEHDPDNNPESDPMGSSPHVRGAHYHVRQGGGRPGIIPACAGSTSNHSRLYMVSGDHPRMCGEHPVVVAHALHLPGSSPHVRGARNPNMPPFHIGGIIPACAGSTCRPSMVDVRQGDHPRMCGEHCRAERGIRPI